MTKFDNFFNYANGKAWDKYGNRSYISEPQTVKPFGGQCVSLIKTYLLYLYGNKVKDSYGDAKDYWTDRNWNGILDLCTVVGDLKNGDIVVSSGSDPRFGHIFIYKDGQAFTQNCANNPKATLYPLTWQGSIIGILRPDVLVQNYDLIPEHRIATVKKGHIINIRRDNPVGMIVRTAKEGTRIEYTEKCVGFGHRYISWIENGVRLFMACTPTTAQKDHWIDISTVPTSQKPTTIKGIDISAHQANVDFSQVKKSVDFVIPRCSYGTITDGYFKSYVKGCKEQGIPVPGVYVFDYALTDDAAIGEAEHAISLCKEVGLSKDTVIYFDCEYDSVDYAKDASRNKTSSINKDRAMVQRHTRLFMDAVKKAGFKTGYYANLDWMNRYYNGFTRYPGEKFWYARPGHTPEYSYDVYQYGTESIPGIKGATDVNYAKSGTAPAIKPSAPAEKWNINGIVKAGSTVKSRSCYIAPIPGRNTAITYENDIELVYVPELGGLVPTCDLTEASDSKDGKVDNVLSNTKARVYLDPMKVDYVNTYLNTTTLKDHPGKNRYGKSVMIKGYTVNSEPLLVKE